MVFAMDEETLAKALAVEGGVDSGAGAGRRAELALTARAVGEECAVCVCGVWAMACRARLLRR